VTLTDTVTMVPRQVLRLQYGVMRSTLQLVEDRVVSRVLPEDNPARLGYERALGTLDGTAGKLLGDPAAIRRGNAIAARAEALADAARLETQAGQVRRQGEDELKEGAAAAARRRRAAQETEQHRLAEASRRAAETKQHVEDQAERTAASRKAAADRAAKATRARASESLQATVRAVTAREEAAAAPARAALADAATQRAKAAEQRKDAAHLADLAETAGDAGSSTAS
jgi:hypothetical protein